MIKWIYRYIHAEKSNWKYLVDHALKPVGGEFVFKCNLAKDESIILNIVSSLWKKIVISWCQMHFVPNDTISPNDIVWLNSNLANIMQHKKCVEQGLLYVKQFYDGDNICTLEMINENAGNSLDIIYYNRIVQTLRMKHYNNEHAVKMDNECKNIVKIILEKPDVKYIGKRLYRYLIKSKTESNVISKKWVHLVHIDDDNYNLFSHIDKITIVNKLRSFQFKFLHRIVFFNDRLFKYKLVSTTLCDFCNQSTDSLDHRYFYCPVTQEFWRQLNNWVETEYNINCIVNNIYNIIRNKYGEMSIMDTIMLNAKYYIYTCFLNKKIPTIKCFKTVVKEVENTEHYIAAERNILHVHETKWGRVATR